MEPNDNQLHEHKQPKKEDLVCAFHDQFECCVRGVKTEVGQIKTKVNRIFVIMAFTAGGVGTSTVLDLADPVIDLIKILFTR